MTLHEQAAAAMRDLRATIAGLESKLRVSKRNYVASNCRHAEPIVPPVVQPVKAEAEVHAETKVAAPSSTDLQSPESMHGVDVLNALVPEKVSPEQPETALTEPLMLLEVPQLEEKSAALSIPKEQAIATVQVTPEPGLKTIVPEPAPAIKAAPTARKLPAPKNLSNLKNHCVNVCLHHLQTSFMVATSWSK